MRLWLRWYGPLKEAVGTRETEIELPDGTILGQLPLWLRAAYGERLYELLGGEEPFNAHIVMVNGHHYVGLQGLETPLADGYTVTIMHSVTGG